MRRAAALAIFPFARRRSRRRLRLLVLFQVGRGRVVRHLQVGDRDRHVQQGADGDDPEGDGDRGALHQDASSRAPARS